MFSDLSYCNCRVCGKRLDYFTLGAVFRYDWDQVGWAYCKQHIPQNSIAIDHCELVSLSYDDSSPAFKIDVDAVLTDGSVIPYTCDLVDIPGVKAVLEQVQGTVGKIVDLTGTNWTFNPDTGEITVDGTADIRNFTPSPILNTKFEKLLKDTTLVPKIQETVKVANIAVNGTTTFDTDAGTATIPLLADTDHPNPATPTSLAKNLNLSIADALRKVKVDYVKQDGDLEYNKDTTTLKIPIKADTDWPGSDTSKKVFLEFDIHEYFPPAPTPGDPAKVAYIQKNGTESFNPDNNVLTIPLKADTNMPASGTSLTTSLTIDLSQTIADAMKKVKVDYIQKNGDVSFNPTTGDLTIPTKADTDHPGSGSSKNVNLTVNINDQLKTVKVDYVKQNGDTSFNKTTSVLTIPVKADTDHPGSGTSKENNLTIDISDELETVKVDSDTITTDPTKIKLKTGSTKVIVVPVDADTDHPGSGSKGTSNLEIDISQWQGGDDYPKVDYVKYYEKKTIGHKDLETNENVPRLYDESPAGDGFPVKIMDNAATGKPYYQAKVYKIGYDSDTTKPKANVTDKKDVLEEVPITLPTVKVAWETIKGQGWGPSLNDPDRPNACARHQNDLKSPEPVDEVVLGTELEDYARKAMMVRTELQADVNEPYKFDLADGYPDVTESPTRYPGLKGASSHTSFGCTGLNKNARMGLGRVPVNVIDNNWWDQMWEMASGGLLPSTSTFVILDPIDPDNPHDVYISDACADLAIKYKYGDPKFAAGPFFDPAINIRSMHDDVESIANASVVHLDIKNTRDKATIKKLVDTGGATAASSMYLTDYYLDGGLYQYHTNADSGFTNPYANDIFGGIMTTDKISSFKPWQPIYKIHSNIYAQAQYPRTGYQAQITVKWVRFFSFTSASSRNASGYPALWLTKEQGYAGG